jgi:hypothetical protein
MKYQVEYSVTGYPELFLSPKYSKEEVISQRDDIAGFEGVEYAVIIPANTEND